MTDNVVEQMLETHAEGTHSASEGLGIVNSGLEESAASGSRIDKGNMSAFVFHFTYGGTRFHVVSMDLHTYTHLSNIRMLSELVFIVFSLLPMFIRKYMCLHVSIVNLESLQREMKWPTCAHRTKQGLMTRSATKA